MSPVARLGLASLLAALLLSPAHLAAEGRRADSSGPTAPPPSLSLSIAHRGPTVPWELEIENTGSAPVHLSADPRLLWFEVKVPGKTRTTTCRLPTELFPSRPAPGTGLVLEPGDRATHRFDPRLYCFAASGQTQLVPGTQVSPRFGWPERRRTRWVAGKRLEETLDEPPYVGRTLDPTTAPCGAAKGSRGPSEEDGPGVKLLSAPGFALGSEYAAWSRVRVAPDPAEDSPFQLTLVQGSDATAERTATVQLALVNRGSRARYVYFRRELVSFEVVGPSGHALCDPQPDARSPDRHAFQRLAPGQRITVYNRLVELCPRGTFGSPGLYMVHARFDAARDGAEYDLDAFVGRAATSSPVGVRIRTGSRPPPTRMAHVTAE